jgi:hypothetical protein
MNTDKTFECVVLKGGTPVALGTKLFMWLSVFIHVHLWFLP